ncbi:MAG: hypothetical protein Q9160_007374 [Pyrenula sp. 1 TL-2023]
MDSSNNRDSGSHSEFQEVRSRLRSVKGTRENEKDYHETHVEETERSVSAMGDLEQMIDDALEQQSALRKERGLSTVRSSRDATSSGANQAQAAASRSDERIFSSERDSYQHTMESSRSHKAQQYQSIKSRSAKETEDASKHWSDSISTRSPAIGHANDQSKWATSSEERRKSQNSALHSNEGPRSVRQRAAAFEKQGQSSRSKARQPKEHDQNADERVPATAALLQTKYSPVLPGNRTSRDEDEDEHFIHSFGVEGFDRAKARQGKQHGHYPKQDNEVFAEPQDYLMHDELRPLSPTIRSSTKQNDVNINETTHAAETPVTPTPSPQKRRPITRQISSFLSSKRGWVFQDKNPSTPPTESKENAHAAGKHDVDYIAGRHEHSGERDSALDEFVRMDRKYEASQGKNASRDLSDEMGETGRSTLHTSALSRDTRSSPNTHDVISEDRTDESHVMMQTEERRRANVSPKQEPLTEEAFIQNFPAKSEGTSPPVKHIRVERLSPKRYSHDDKVDNILRSSERYFSSEEKYSNAERTDSTIKATEEQVGGPRSKSISARTSRGERHEDQHHEKSRVPSGDYFSTEAIHSSTNKWAEPARTPKESSTKQTKSHTKNEMSDKKSGVSSEALSPVSARLNTSQQQHSIPRPNDGKAQTRVMRNKSRSGSDEARNVSGLSKVQRMARNLDQVSTSTSNIASSEGRRSLESRIAASRRQSQAQAPAHTTIMSPSSEEPGDEFLSHQLKELHTSLPPDMRSPPRYPAATTILEEEDEESHETESAFNKSMKDANTSLQVNLSATATPLETPGKQPLTRDDVTERRNMTSVTVTPVRGRRRERSGSSPPVSPIRGQKLDASTSPEPFPSPGLGSGIRASTGVGAGVGAGPGAGAGTSAALAQRSGSLARRTGDSRAIRLEERYGNTDTSANTERRWEANSCVSVRVEVRTSPERVGYASTHAGWDKEFAREETGVIHGHGHGHGHGDRVITVNASVTPRKESEQGEES